MPNPHFFCLKPASGSAVQVLRDHSRLLQRAFRKTNFCILDRFEISGSVLLGFGGSMWPLTRQNARRGKVPLSVASVKPIPLLIVLPLQFVDTSTLGRIPTFGPEGDLRSWLESPARGISQTVQCRILSRTGQGAGMVQIRELAVEAWINRDRITCCQGSAAASSWSFRLLSGGLFLRPDSDLFRRSEISGIRREKGLIARCRRKRYISQDSRKISGRG